MPGVNHQHTRGLPVLHPTTSIVAPDPRSPRPHRHAAPDELDLPPRLVARRRWRRCKLWHQRLRRQRGAPENLRDYGWTRVTARYFVRQFLMGFGALSFPARRLLHLAVRPDCG
ncbi:conserved hypothetical protein [Streptomyces sviceus ATCC 29083]|uniref:Uncharacterized protein n=1 Tax=Streptomyces sviceus (strain ATCC 29083 / DSM 924 / JCM 4929 / NBRC 13980 / NCIMB 11184 / NRRL 5439 / UC 5370) TaxID=463191 RepID=B5HTR2_STRX2|nr:conserved hypothetical protein [Streptomyces sviceus ATCC 29083]